jgi:hypothetical protein
MSEIKVGDIVKVYSVDAISRNHREYECRCVVTHESGTDCLSVRSLCCISEKLVHRKQCRKLVKVKKCDVCSGDGNLLNKFHRKYAGILTEIIECPNCKGKGKVKV